MPTQVLLKRARACRPGTETHLGHIGVSIRKPAFSAELAIQIDVQRSLVACPTTQRSLQQNNQTLNVGQNRNILSRRFCKPEEQRIGGQPMPYRRFGNADHFGLKCRQVLEGEVVTRIDL